MVKIKPRHPILVIVAIFLWWLSIFIHEMGHAIPILYYGAEVINFEAILLGGRVTMNGFLTIEQLRVVLLSGGILSMTLMMLLAIIFHLAKIKSMALVSLFTILLNLVYMSDPFYYMSDMNKYLRITPEIVPVIYFVVMWIVCMVLFVFIEYYMIIVMDKKQ